MQIATHIASYSCKARRGIEEELSRKELADFLRIVFPILLLLSNSALSLFFRHSSVFSFMTS